jgi:hypothetical protein
MNELKELIPTLRRQRSSLPSDARPHISNLIEQIKGIEDEEDAQRMKPFIMRSLALLALANG